MLLEKTTDPQDGKQREINSGKTDYRINDRQSLFTYLFKYQYIIYVFNIKDNFSITFMKWMWQVARLSQDVLFKKLK